MSGRAYTHTHTFSQQVHRQLYVEDPNPRKGHHAGLGVTVCTPHDDIKGSISSTRRYSFLYLEEEIP